MSISEISSGSSSSVLAFPELTSLIKRTPVVSEARPSPKQDAQADPRLQQDSEKRLQAELLKEVGKSAVEHNPNLSELSVGVDQETNKIVVKLVNSETKEVIRQIPPEEVLRLAEKMKELQKGLLDRLA